MLISHVLFDLDGTLTDPAEGITNSFMYALKKFGIAVGSRSELYCCIGPPLMYSFRTFWQMSEADARLAVQYYREYFAEHGIYQNALYPGIPELLRSLTERGIKCYLATSKLEDYAVQILRHYGIDGYFTGIAGNTLGDTRPEKKDVIGHLINSYSTMKCENALMVGDRRYDVEGAQAAGLSCVGVLYGYGDREELVSAGADYVAETVGALESLLLGL
jgi:phosphoglycolate phosphatase